MGRPKEFDTEQALSKAAEMFRQRGYEGTSTNDLLLAMGIGRGSLYATFGTKEDLFRAAFSRYRKSTFDAVVAQLKASDDPKQALVDFLVSRADLHGRKEARAGCLIANTTTELEVHGEHVRDDLARAWKRLEDGFAHTIRRAQNQGTIDPRKSARDLAKFCVLLMRGLAVGATIEKSPKAARAAVRIALDSLA